MKQWIMPENYDHAKAEATHLIHESDVDNVSDKLCVCAHVCVCVCVHVVVYYWHRLMHIELF